MLKNAIIALLSTALLFTNTILSEYGWLPYIAVSAVAFVVVCAIEDMWEKRMNSIRLLERFKRDANRKITLNTPTKAS